MTSQTITLTALDTNATIEQITLYDNGLYGPAIFKDGYNSAKVSGHLTRKKITVFFNQKAEFKLCDRGLLDGMIYNNDKSYYIDVSFLYSNGPFNIPDSNIIIMGQTLSTNRTNNGLTFDTNDSIIIITGDNFYDLTVRLPEFENQKQHHTMIFASVIPKIDIIKDSKMIFDYDKKKGIAICDGVSYLVTIEK